MSSLATISQGSERPRIACVWTHADNTTGEDLTDAALTGYIKNLTTGETVQIQGALTVTDATAGVFTWTPDPFDVAEDGAYQVQFSATWPGEPTPGLTAVFDWEIAESIIPTDAPSALPDYQGVVKLLARTTNPDNAPADYYGLFVKNAALWLIDESGTLTAFDDGSTAAAAAIAAHVGESDPHPDYLLESDAASTYAPIAHNHDGVYAPASHTHAVTDVTDLAEYVQDTAAGMITGATHTNVSVAYDDTAGTLAFTAAATYDNEMAQDAAAAALVAGTHAGVSVAYVDVDNAINITNTDGGAAAVATHEGASDPHPDYLKQAEADALYAPITVTQYTDEMAQDAVAAALAAGTHTNITVTYNDAANTLSLAGAVTYTDEQAQDAAASMLTGATHTGVSVAYTDASNTLAITNTDGGAAAVSTHVGLADPHTQYLLESNANWVDLTDTGATTLHSHAVTWDAVTGKPSIYQSTLFLHSTAADVATYKTALTVPSSAAETNVTAVCNSAGGEVLLSAFITAPMGVSVINGNAWSFKTFGKVDSATGVTNIVVRVYKRDTVGTETQLFTDLSAEINATVATKYDIDTVQSSFTVLPSDRMVIKYFAKTTSGSNRTVTLYYQGTENASHTATPVLFASLTVATDTIWQAKGDLAVGTANDTAAVLGVSGNNGRVLTENSAATNGIEWAALPTMYTNENAQDAVAAALAAGTHTGVTVAYDDAGAAISLTNTITQYTDELAQDAVAAAFAAGSHTNVTVTYDDTANSISLAASGVGGYTDEQAQDAAASLFTTATHSGATVSYDDGAGTLAITVTGGSGIPVSTIDAKGDLLAGTAADTVARLAVGATNGMQLTVASGESTGMKWALPVRYLALGRAGTLTATAGTARLYVPFACTVVNIRASVGTAPTGADLIVDVHKSGTTLFTTQGNRPTIAASAFTDLTNTPDVTAIAADTYLTVDVDQIGSTIAGADLLVIVEVTVP